MAALQLESYATVTLTREHSHVSIYRRQAIGYNVQPTFVAMTS
jgi:hypothetical protein